MISINQHILSSLLKAKKQLSNEALQQISSFIVSQKHSNGGFINRSGKADPYYSLFGYTLSYVHDIPIDWKKEQLFLNQWQKQYSVDFVHAISLLRSYYLLEAIRIKQTLGKIALLASKHTIIQNFTTFQIARKIRKKHKNLLLLVSQHKTKNNGFNQSIDQLNHASVYANFLAYSLFEDLHFNKTWRRKIALSNMEMQLDNGSFVNHPKSKEGIASTTAAGLLMLSQQQLEYGKTCLWLKTIIDNNGGFLAGEQVPISDVLSTATCVIALNVTKQTTNEINTKAIEFVNLHWHESGGFFGSIADQKPDIEYTFYGILTIGQL